MNRRLTRFTLVTTLAAAASLALASSAGATFDLIKVREITGDTLGGNQSYIELQMYAPGQNLVSGHNITVWDEDGLVLGTAQPIQTHTLTGPNPPNGGNQRTILIGDTGVANADFTIPELSSYLENQVGADLVEGGAICYEAIPIDCVAWGQNFTGANNLPDRTTGNGSNMPTGLLALQRNISADCPTALDAADDTNNGGADFTLTGANPTPNSAIPTEVPCTGGAGGGAAAPAPSTCGGNAVTLFGTDGNDTLSGTPGPDVISGLGGNDKIKGLAGNDAICGGAGKDTLVGGKGKDELLGEGGKDTLKGGPGKDKLKGGPGGDILKGGPGKDKLKGGAAKDVQIQ